MKLHEVEPREQAGRDTINRFRAQFRAATIESLALLENKEIERIYCDYHEDYVVKYIINEKSKYRFVQVKTKSKLNHCYTILEIFGLKKRSRTAQKHDLPGSFAGKLLLHIENFADTCHSIEIKTNVNFDDEVEGIINDIQSKGPLGAHTSVLIKETQKLIPTLAGKSEAEILDFLSHLNLEPRQQILNEHDDLFVSMAANQIFKFSEVHLTPDEVKKIIVRLLSAIEEKSAIVFHGEITEAELNEQASICIDDVLEVLSISKSTYEILRAGGDDKAIKSASILKRTLTKSGFSPMTVDTFAGYKCQWEAWYRKFRHEIPDFVMTIAIELVIQRARKLAWGQIQTSEITTEVKELQVELCKQLGRSDITDELTFGAMLSELVRGEAT
ncbi:dsDNA nuclease domain-containing protein [Pseudomonas sp. GCM10022186]|uniref:dsDNA nuclease domain-containing protein n=1 Tax=Pseudomonas sp. GCM10022186 TaxID=3252650 RepID=UPI00361C1970